MNRIHRQARMSALEKNRFIRYLLYAIGEIILLIVGILIALQINNRNEQNKNELKIRSILSDVQRDLISDLEDLEGVIGVYELKDSLIDMVLTDTLTESDYQKNPTLIILITTYSSFEVKDNAYKNLMRNSDYIPVEMSEVVPKLDAIYLQTNKTMKEMQTELSDLVNETLRSWSNKHTWYSDLSRNSYNPEFVEFFLSDPFYKNSLVTYQIYASDNLLVNYKNFQAQAVQAYRSIHQVLGSHDTLPAIISNYSVVLAAQETQELTGKFRGQNGSELMIEEDNGDLMIGSAIRGRVPLYAKSDSVLFNHAVELQIDYHRNDSNEFNSFTLHINGRDMKFERVLN